jgi:hypothetical protein
MRAALLFALPLVVAGCKKKLDVDEISMVKLVRAPLSIELPDWEIAEDARDPALGKHKLQRSGDGSEFVEVSWQGGEPMSAADLETLGRSTIEGFKLSLADSSSSSKAGELHYSALARLGSGRKEVWLSLTLIQCERTNVTVTVGVGTRDEKATRALTDKIMATFACLGDSPDKFAADSSPPSSSLADDFGYTEVSGSTLVVHADGRAVFIFRAGGDNSGAIAKHADKTLATFGKLLEMNIVDVGEPTTRTGVGGAKMAVVTAKSSGDSTPLVAASYYCRDARTSYTLLALSDAPADLTALVTQFGCPGAAKPVSERKSACDVGAKDFCAD